jgi:transcriptional regulator of heat shock response
MLSREQQILRAVIENFIACAAPVGSHALENFFNLSSATIRNVMHDLTLAEYLFQPHISAGRVPTQKGYRFFVDTLAGEASNLNRSRQAFLDARQVHVLKKAREKIYDAVAILARAVENIAFATVPGKERAIFFGFARALKNPEFASEPEKISEVFEILEGDFVDFLETLELTEAPRILIGRENIFPEFESCSLLVREYAYEDFSGKIGVVGPMRMDYGFNLGVLNCVAEWIESKER